MKRLRFLLILVFSIVELSGCQVNECLGDCGVPDRTFDELLIEGISFGTFPSQTAQGSDFRFVEGEYGPASSGYIAGRLGILVLPDNRYESESAISVLGNPQDYELGGRDIIYFSLIENGVETPLDSRRYYCGGSETSPGPASVSDVNPTIESVYATSSHEKVLTENRRHVLERVSVFCIPALATHVVHRVVDNDLQSRIVRQVPLSKLWAWQQFVP